MCHPCSTPKGGRSNDFNEPFDAVKTSQTFTSLMLQTCSVEAVRILIE